jgi:hypothetical protein
VSHVRQQLRQAVADRVTNLATTGTRVFQSRVYPLQAADLPGICVFVPAEEADEATIHGMSHRLPEVVVAGYASATGTLEDTLDLIAEEVEVALSTPVAVGAKQLQLVYAGYESELAEGDKPHGVGSTRWRAELFTNRGAPEAAL